MSLAMSLAKSLAKSLAVSLAKSLACADGGDLAAGPNNGLKRDRKGDPDRGRLPCA